MKITIITVVYNRVKTIEKTILSVLSQTYNNFEYIIIDGGSTDGTCEIINKYKSSLLLYISESDKGIYDAMNKGIKNVSDNNSYILFLNSDDYLINDKILENISKTSDKYDFIYGKVLYKHDKKNLDVVLGNIETYQTLYKGMIQHQSCFVKKSLLENFQCFDTNYRIAADFDFSIKVFKNNRKIYFIDLIVSVMNMGGVGSVNFIKMYKEKLNIIYHHYKYSIYLIEFLKVYIIKIPKALLSNFLHRFIYKIKKK